jgi:hypothetical protein
MRRNDGAVACQRVAGIEKARASVGAGSTLTVPGTLSQFAGATTTLRGGTIQTNAFHVLGGTLAGNGTINGRVVSDGIISPGFSPGLLEITGDLDLNLASELVIELAGLLPGAFDVVAITGDLTFESALAGTLRISLLDGFQPGLGDTFEIITFGSRVGGFGSFAGLNLPNGEVLSVKRRTEHHLPIAQFDIAEHPESCVQRGS